LKNYSQFGEQAAILAAFGFDAEGYGHGPDCPVNGLGFLDVGSWDPITFSNTRALFELGWYGVMIEPAPGPMLELLRCCTKCAVGVDARKHEAYGDRTQRECETCGAERYGFCERLTILQAACGLVRGFVQMSMTDDALSTSDEASRAKWDKVGGFYGRVYVPVITLEQIAVQFGGFSFVNLDVEGQSAELFLRMLTLGILPPCVCVEHDNRLVELAEAATRQHYSMTYSNSTNGVFVRK
jgi:hypothetical protein